MPGSSSDRARQFLQGDLPIEKLGEAEQDVVFDALMQSYMNPPSEVRKRLTEIAERTEWLLAEETEKTVSAIQSFLERADKQFRIREAYLFGSRARGDHQPDSDADLAVIVEDMRPDDRLSAKMVMAEIAFDTMMDTDILIQAHPFTPEEWDTASGDSSSLIEKARNEGIRL